MGWGERMYTNGERKKGEKSTIGQFSMQVKKTMLKELLSRIHKTRQSMDDDLSTKELVAFCSVTNSIKQKKLFALSQTDI